MHSNERLFRDLAAVMIRVINQFTAYEALPRTYGVGHRLYPAEIYAIDTIGRHPDVNVTGLAVHLGITKGAASQAIGKLVRKRLVRKTRMPGNAKEVRLELTTWRRKTLENLDRHYHQFYQASRRYYGAELRGRLTTFHRAFQEFGEYFEALTYQVPVDCPPAAPIRAKAHYSLRGR